jgi:cytochrome P450
MLSLIITPQALRRILAEIDAGIAACKISSPVTNTQALALPYLQAMIRESLRMYPPVAARNLGEVPPSGNLVSNGEAAPVHLPGGTLLGHDVYGIMQSCRIWGLDADIFRPERWLEGGPAETAFGIIAQPRAIAVDSL